MSEDRLVVLRAVDRRHAAKTFTKICDKKLGADRIKEQSFSQAKHFTLEEVVIGGFDEMCAALDRVERDPCAFVIRGEPLPGINRRHTRRKGTAKGGKDDTFKAAARHWLPLDFDHLPGPPLTDVVNEPLAAIRHLIGLLPPEFHDVSCRWQFTSSQGLPGSEDALSARLYYWSHQPLSDAELTRWASFVNRDTRIIDASLYRIVQPIYVARPLFKNMDDPLPNRSGVWRGLEDDVEVIIPPPDPKNAATISGQGYEPGRGVEAWLALFGDPRHTFRKLISSAIASYIAIYGSRADVHPLYRAIRARLDEVEPGWRGDPKGQRYADDEHLDKITEWVRGQHGDQPPKGRIIPDPPPHIIDPPPPDPDPDPPPLPRPVVRTGGGRLPKAIDAAERVLIASNANVYVFGDQVVRPALRPVQTADEKETVGLRLVPIGPDHFVDRLTGLIDFQRYNEKKDKWVSTDCPPNIAKSFLARVGLWRLPQLTALTSCPLLLRRGRILDKPGFDRESGILFDAQGAAFPMVKRDPAPAECLQALEFLMHPFREYPFVDDASKSVLRSLLLTTVSRLAYPFAPCFGFSATGAGTGKSKLFDCASILQTGRECEVVTQPEDKVEFEKKLFAFLLAGGGILNIDNCEDPLTNPFLCILLTQRYAQSRVLGLSKNASVPTTATIGANGNNFSFVGDMLRRGLTALLDAGVEKPWEREFESPDPVLVFKRHRPELVAAALTVLRGYLHAGRPKQKAPPLGGFEGWARLVRDALLWLGCDDPCGTIDEARQEDPEQQKFVEVLTQWRAALGGRSLTTRQIAEEAMGGAIDPLRNNPNHITYFHPDLRNALLEVAGERGFVSTDKLGHWLKHHKSRVAALPNGHDRSEDCRIVSDPPLHGYGRWRFERRGEDGEWR